MFSSTLPHIFTVKQIVRKSRDFKAISQILQRKMSLLSANSNIGFKIAAIKVKKKEIWICFWSIDG